MAAILIGGLFLLLSVLAVVFGNRFVDAHDALCTMAYADWRKAEEQCNVKEAPTKAR